MFVIEIVVGNVTLKLINCDALLREIKKLNIQIRILLLLYNNVSKKIQEVFICMFGCIQCIQGVSGKRDEVRTCFLLGKVENRKFIISA